MTNKTLNKVSIRLESGGHTFSIEKVLDRESSNISLKAGVVLRVTLSTPKTTLVPKELFEPLDPIVALAAVGITVAENESVVYGTDNDIVAVMAINTATLSVLKERYGEGIEFRSPLQEDATIEHGTTIRLDNDVMYVRIFDGCMIFAEAIAIESDADILFYMESINSVYGIYNKYASAMGDTQRLRRVCKGYFKKLDIEK